METTSASETFGYLGTTQNTSHYGEGIKSVISWSIEEIETERIVEEWVKSKIMGEIGGCLLKEEYHFVRRFPGFALSSFWCGQYETEKVRMVRSSGLRRGPRDLGWKNLEAVTAEGFNKQPVA
jgi:hypothetical protein